MNEVPQPRETPRRRGFTLVEALVTTLLLSVAIAGIVKVFVSSRRAYAVHEASQTLKKAGLQSIARLQRELVSSKRLFSKASGDPTYFNALQLPAAAADGAALPAVVEGASLEAPAPGAAGNVLLFAVALKPVDVAGVRVGMHRFHCYYLAPEGDRPIGGTPRLELWMWQSVLYADQQALSALSGTLLTDVLNGLAAQGISAAWNVSAATATTNAFYTISGGALSDMSAPVRIAQDKAERGTAVLTGLTGDGFRVGVCPNLAAGAVVAPAVQVPRFSAPAANGFPGGFEIITGGDSQTRQVFVRLVLAAQGTFKGLSLYEQTALVTLRDVW